MKPIPVVERSAISRHWSAPVDLLFDWFWDELDRLVGERPDRAEAIDVGRDGS